MADAVWAPIAELARSVQAGETTSVSLVERALGRIKEFEEYKAIIALTEERARER